MNWLTVAARTLFVFCSLLAPGIWLPHAAGAAQPTDWVTLYQRDFSAGTTAGWPTATTGTYDGRILDGSYSLSTSHGTTHMEGPRPPLQLANGEVSAVVRLPSTGAAGVAARISESGRNAYTFWIDQQGLCGAARSSDGQEVTLFSVKAGSIQPMRANVLSLRAVGGTLTFSINGHTVFHYFDRASLPEGNWGLVVQSETATAKGLFDRLSIVGAARSSTQPFLPAGPFTPRIAYNFALGNNNSWFTSRQEHTTARFTHGRYRVTAVGSYILVEPPRQFPAVANGQIAAMVRMEGAGRVGLAGRWRDNPDGYYSEYACWFDQRGDVGMTREQDRHWTTLFEVPGLQVHPYQDTLVVLRIRGAQVSCSTGNGPQIIYTDRHPLTAGGWGVWVSNYPGGPYVQGEYARILIAY